MITISLKVRKIVVKVMEKKEAKRIAKMNQDKKQEELAAMNLYIGFAILLLSTGLNYQMSNHLKSRKLEKSNSILQEILQEESTPIHFISIKKQFILEPKLLELMHPQLLLLVHSGDSNQRAQEK